MDQPRITKTTEAAGKCLRSGAELPPGSVFCSNCGARRAEQGTPPAAAQTTPAPAFPPSQPAGQGSRLEALWQEQLDRLRRLTLGEYEILGELGRGGMAAVYLAHEIPLDRRVAIKVMSPLLALDDAMLARFGHEARTMASLHHPNTVTIHAVRQAEGLDFFVMQFVEGRPFSEVLRATGPLPLPAVRFLIPQVGPALAH